MSEQEAETVKAKWVVAGDEIYAGIEEGEVSKIKIGVAIVFSSFEDMRKALHHKTPVIIEMADFGE